MFFAMCGLVNSVIQQPLMRSNNAIPPLLKQNCVTGRSANSWRAAR
jgi:hypothetical protein